MPGRTPSLADLYQLAAQLELDRDLPVQSLRERDHVIGQQCTGTDDTDSLMFWLQQITPATVETPAQPHSDAWLTENAAAALARIVALLCGFSGMATFLLTSGRGLVNVFLFLLLFVLVQVLLCVVAAVVMARTVSGRHAVVLPVNPARFIVAKLWPDRRFIREASSVVRLVLLRYGQELGAIFTLGAVAAFFIVLGLSDFTFVWGSTFSLSDNLVERLTATLSMPWSSVLPGATVDAQVIAASRFHPAITDLSMAEVQGMRGWWPFLIMAMVSYALVPRLLLWGMSQYFYTRRMRRALIDLPGSELVLARMKTPLVRTQGEATGPASLAPERPDVATDERLLLLNWSNALTPGDAGQFEQLYSVADSNIINAGLGAISEELERARARLAQPYDQLYVTVKSWEPPMADLADFLAHFNAVSRCTVFLVPLSNRQIPLDRLQDWQTFARGLQFEVVDVQPLHRNPE